MDMWDARNTGEIGRRSKKSKVTQSSNILIPRNKHEMNLTLKIILSFIQVILLYLTVQIRPGWQYKQAVVIQSMVTTIAYV